jgi:hypothetical protein
VTTLLLGSGISVWQAIAATLARDAETAARLELQAAKQLADERAESIARSLEQLNRANALVVESGQFQSALEWYDRMVSVLEGVLQKEPQHTEARMLLSSTHMNRVETLIRLGRRAEAIQDWQRMTELGEGQQHSELRVQRALGLAHLGDHRRATAEVKAMEATGREAQQSVYNFVCVYALSLRAVRDDPGLSPTERNALAAEYGAHAVGLLAKMRSAGFFKSPGVVDHLKRDTDMEPLHQRADFQALVRELKRETGPGGK